MARRSQTADHQPHAEDNGHGALFEPGHAAAPPPGRHHQGDDDDGQGGDGGGEASGEGGVERGHRG